MDKLSKKEKNKLLKASGFFGLLSGRKLFNLVVWGIFKPYKIDRFYNSLNIGKHVFASYDDAEKEVKI